MLHVIKIIFGWPAVILISYHLDIALSGLPGDQRSPAASSWAAACRTTCAFAEIHQWPRQPGVWSLGLGVVPRTSVATLIIPARLLLWVTEVERSTNATACRGCCFCCCLCPFISRDSQVVLSLLMPVWLLMGCAELCFFLSSACLCLSWDNRHDLAN